MAIAKLMLRSEDWQGRLKQEDGVAIISGVSGEVTFRTPTEYASRLSIADTEQLSGYEGSPRELRRPSRRSDIPEAQLPMQPETETEE